MVLNNIGGPGSTNGEDPFNRPMMNSFARTDLYNDISVLSKLRKYNKAVQKAMFL
jgi:hypothetical protein